MKIALIYNLRPAQATTPAWPDDLYAEWDEPETIAAVRAALATAHEVVLIENNSEVEAGLRASAPDIVFNMAEGLSGPDREAHIPALLERWGIPFTGSSAHTLRTCLDKAATKRVLQQHGLPTPAYTVLSCADRLPALPAFPLIVKPLHEGSSKGIESASVVQTRAALQARVAYIVATYHQPALVEAFVPGREFTVALLGNGAEVTVLPLVEICFAALPPGAPPSTPTLQSGSGILQSMRSISYAAPHLSPRPWLNVSPISAAAPSWRWSAVIGVASTYVSIRMDNHRSWS
jgi:D-alanine-D-alanine ligase